MKRLRNIAIVLILTLVCAEIAVRILGWEPLKNEDYSVKADPSNWLIGDSTYGIQLNPGTFQITLEDEVSFSVTHTVSGLRKTVVETNGTDEVLFFGCSFTYGYGVDDTSVFSNQLQAQFPNYTFINRAVPGYGTVQPVLQLETLAQTSQPKCAVLVYSKFHTERNVLSNSYRRALKIGFVRSHKDVQTNMENARIPYLNTVGQKITHADWNQVYTNWAGRETFALVHVLQSTFERDEEEEKQVSITLDLLNRFEKICRTNDIVPVIVNLDDINFNERYSNNLSDETEIIHINFDFEDKRLTNLPYDLHPNHEGHRFIAQKIEKQLKKVLDEEE